MGLQRFPAAFGLAVLLAFAGRSLSGRQGASADRLPIPPQSEQVPALQALRETFKPRFADSSETISLAAELRKLARDFDRDPTGRYVYINEARRLSLDAGDLSATLQAIADLSRYYLVDTSALQIEAVTKVANAVGQEEANVVAELALDLVEELMSSSDFISADKVLKAGTPLRQKLSEPSVQSRWNSTIWHLGARKEADAAREKLRGEPDDARSLETVGRYMCLVENEFEQGLPMLKRVPLKNSRDKVLQRLAEDDILGALEWQGQFQLGTRWLDLAKSLEPMERRGPCLRAIYWYEKAQPALTGTAKGVELTVKIKEAREMELAPPPVESSTAAQRAQEGKRSEVLDTELVLNGDCEEIAAGSGIPLWVIVSGDWIPSDEPHYRADGKFFRPTGKKDVEEIRQDIDITKAWKEARGGSVSVTVTAKVYGHFQHNVGEESQVVVEFLNNAEKLTGTSLNYGPEWAQGWRDVSLSGEVPRSTTRIRLRLVAHRRSGTSNDAVFDNLSLKLSRDSR